MATDISNSYDKANENLAKLRTFSESKNAINEALKKGENISTPSFDFSTFQENQSELESKIKKKVQNQLDQLLNLVLANKGSGNSTTDYLKSTFLTTAKSLRTKILEILVEEIIKALGCDLEQTYDAQKIYIKVSSIDLFKLLQTNPATTAGKFLYEPSAFDPNSSPRSTNKMLYNLTQNPNIFYSNPSLYGQNYLGVSYAGLFDIRFVQINPNNGNAEGWYEIDLLNRPPVTLGGTNPPNKVSQFLVDYYNTISIFELKTLLTSLVEAVLGVVSIKLRFAQGTVDDSTKFGLLIQRILGLCFDEENEISVGGNVKTPELDDTTDTFFEITNLDTSIIEQRSSEIIRGVVSFESCNYVELPVNPDPIIDIIENIEIREDGEGFTKALNKISIALANDPSWSATFPYPDQLKITLDFSFIKKLPQAVVSSVMSPKTLLPFLMMIKALGIPYNENLNGLSSFVSQNRQLMKNLVSRIGAEFVKTLFEDLKREIRVLVRQIILDIVKDDQGTIYLMIERLVNLAKKIISIVDDYRKCKSVIDAILQLFNLIPRISFGQIPLPILKFSEFLPGMSPNREFIEGIAQFQKLGIPTGPLPDGSPNIMLLHMYGTMKAIDTEIKVNGKIQGTFTFTAPPIVRNLRITGKLT